MLLQTVKSYLPFQLSGFSVFKTAGSIVVVKLVELVELYASVLTVDPVKTVVGLVVGGGVAHCSNGTLKKKEKSKKC